MPTADETAEAVARAQVALAEIAARAEADAAREDPLPELHPARGQGYVHGLTRVARGFSVLADDHRPLLCPYQARFVP